MTCQTYRAGVGWLIFNAKKEFLFVHLVGVRADEWDFVKWGMEAGESHKATLMREIREELWENFSYQILEKSNWRIVYEWPVEVQQKKWHLGTVRTSFWVFANNMEINLCSEELDNYCWIPEDRLYDTMIWSDFPEEEYQKFELEWTIIQQKYKHLFVT